MLREMLKSKIFRATVTEANLEYEGSLSLCPKLREAADLLVNEKVLVVNLNNGLRFDTYLLDGVEGQVCLNGAAARLGELNDKVIIMSFCRIEDSVARTHEPIKVSVDDNNKITEIMS